MTITLGAFAVTSPTAVTLAAAAAPKAIVLIGVGTTPDAFTFTPQTGVTLSSPRTSNLIVVSGLAAGISVPVTVSNGSYIKNGAAKTSAAGTARNDDTFRAYHDASSSSATAKTTTLTIGGVDGTFTSTTA